VGFKVLSRHLLRGTDENHENFSKGSLSPDKIRTRTSRIRSMNATHSAAYFVEGITEISLLC
jgi:hypothetical protein